MKRPITRSFLALSGAMALVIGGAILIAPHAFYASNQIVLGSDPNLLSEVRAPGGLLLAAGLMIVAGAVSIRLMRTALLIAALVFSLYGLSRLLSLMVDGVPNGALVGALVAELCIGGVAAALFVRRKGSLFPSRLGPSQEPEGAGP